MSESSTEIRYLEVTRRMNAVAAMGAVGITALMLIATWGDWPKVLVVVGVQASLVPFNTWVTLWLLSRAGVRRGEIVRTVVNLVGTVLIGHFTGWPLPMWLWLPFVAVAFEHLGARIASVILIAMCAVQDAVALYDGVPWIHPLVFTALALFCSAVSRLRVGVISEMLARSDEQRVEVELAHARIREAHDKLTLATREREEVELELRHAHKLEAVGRLAAGVAHEINTPVQFANDSIHFLRDASQDLVKLVEGYRAAQSAVVAGAPARDAAERTAELEEELDIAFALEQLPKAIERSLEGLERVRSIVRSMKEFAHPDGQNMRGADLNAAIQASLTMARGEYKHVADLELDLEPLPPVVCHAGEINQVLLNLLVNAAHAIADNVKGDAPKGRITVRARREGAWVSIAVSDTGIGIKPEDCERIFEPFFTTKEVGRGTGQGLAIARKIVQRHRGALTFTTALGAGTTFSMRLPLDPASVPLSERNPGSSARLRVAAALPLVESLAAGGAE